MLIPISRSNYILREFVSKLYSSIFLLSFSFLNNYQDKPIIRPNSHEIEGELKLSRNSNWLGIRLLGNNHERIIGVWETFIEEPVEMLPFLLTQSHTPIQQKGSLSKSDSTMSAITYTTSLSKGGVDLLIQPLNKFANMLATIYIINGLMNEFSRKYCSN